MAGGRLGDIFGHRNVLICGMTLFNAACILCALVNDKIGLVVGRAFQGSPPPVDSVFEREFETDPPLF